MECETPDLIYGLGGWTDDAYDRGRFVMEEKRVSVSSKRRASVAVFRNVRTPTRSVLDALKGKTSHNPVTKRSN